MSNSHVLYLFAINLNAVEGFFLRLYIVTLHHTKHWLD